MIGSSTVLVIIAGFEGVPGAGRCDGEEEELVSIDGRERSGRLAACPVAPQTVSL